MTRRLPLSSAPPFNLGPLPDEPIELPWSRKVGRHTTVTVDRAGIDEISLHLSSGGYAVAPDITADEARSIARALWAAAEGDAHTPAADHPSAAGAPGGES